MHLQENADCPIICFIGRLAHQKGIDILCSVLDWLMTGTPPLINVFSTVCRSVLDWLMTGI
jgi:glycogen synthase